MITHMAKITCPTCGKTYQIKFEQKGISQIDDSFQLACHSCGTVWTPKASTPARSQAQAQPSVNQAPQQPCPTYPEAKQQEVFQVYTPPPPPQAQAPQPQQTWTPQPTQPFIPPQQLNPPKRNIGATIGLIVLATCVIMGSIVGVLRHKEGKPLTWLTSQNTILPPSQTNPGNEELTIRDVRFDIQQTGKRQTILVVGMIDNATHGAFTLHPLQVSVWGPADQEGVSPTAPKDKDGQCLLISWQHPFDVLHIEPGKSRPFQTVGSLPAGLQISRVDVTLP